MDNGIVSVNIEYDDREGFLDKAKLWLLEQVVVEKEDGRFSNMFHIVDEGSLKRTILLIAASHFHPYLSFHRTRDHMVCLFDGRQAQEMETVASYLLEDQYLVDFIRDLHDESFSAVGGPSEIPYTAAKEIRGMMLLKTDDSLDEVRKHLRRFTRIKTIDGYDDHGNPVNERWLYFSFTEQLTTQEWLKNSEAEVTSHFMKPFDEILFARCDTCSFHRIVKNADKIIENPKYPNLNGGFLLTEKTEECSYSWQKNAYCERNKFEKNRNKEKDSEYR